MRWIIATTLLLIGAVYCSQDDSNEVIIGTSIKPPINLDTNLRKALLKALVELETEDRENLNRETRNDYVNIITHLDTRGKTVEKASASAVSYFTQSEPVNMTVTVKKTTSKPKQIVVVQKSKGTHKTIYDNNDLDLSETPEQFIASASSSFTESKLKSEKRDNPKTITGGANLNSVTSHVKTKKSKYEQTTTTAKPTSSTEESEANVESLQFFSAPLVTAFTIHQDEKGLPRSVVPIYNTAENVRSTTERELEQKRESIKEDLKQEVLKQQKELEARQELELRERQKKLEQEIRRLTKLKEEQERIIREQTLSYEQKILEQQKKLFEEQKRLFNNVQPFVPVTTTPRPLLQAANQFSNNNNNNNFRANSGTLVSIQPSLGFVQPTPVSSLPANAQILPVKNAVDFRTPFLQSFGTFNVQNSITPESRPLVPSQPVISFVNTPQRNVFQNTQLPLVNTAQNPLGSTVQNTFGNPAQNPLVNTAQNVGFFQNLPSPQRSNSFRQSSAFSTSQSLPFVSLQNASFRPSESTAPSHGTRSLRQETGTGNFVNNNRLNGQESNSNFFLNHRFNRNPFLSQTVSQSAPVFRQNFGGTSPTLSQYNTLQYSVDQPFVNQRLNNLLYYSGLGQGRQQEDLNIVSKVLSLNHLGSADSQFANSNVDDRRIRAPSANWRVV